MKLCTIPMLLTIFALYACHKPHIPEATINTPQELQSFLNKEKILEVAPVLGELTTTDFNVPDAVLQTLPAIERQAYMWEANLYPDTESSNDWNNEYAVINQVNEAQELLDKMNASEADKKPLRGCIQFIRGYTYFNIVSLFAKPYDKATAASDWGIVKKTTTNPAEKTVRITNKESYDLLLDNIHEAANLLPAFDRGNYITRPSKPAAYALLSRIYLSMHEYVKAGLYADSSLRLYNNIIDYNKIKNLVAPLSMNNEEVLFRSKFTCETFKNLSIINSTCPVDTSLYNLYDSNDLRRTIYFEPANGMIYVKANYAANATALFSGLATDELYLIRAECYAREGNKEKALMYLNKLLVARYEEGTFQPLTASTAEDVLKIVLLERRKELCFRSLRFYDIRRLNMEGANITLTRKVNGKILSLPPNSSKYVMPLPPGELDTDKPQNPPR